MKHIDHLRQQSDARIERNGLPFQSVRLAFSVVMLVKIVDAFDYAVRKAQLTRDLGAALATGGDQILCDFGTVAQYGQHCPEPLRQASLAAGMRQDEAQHMRQAIAHALEVAL